MTLKDKYKNALALGEKLQIKDGYVTEENGKLKIGGTTQYQLEKDRLWDAIKVNLTRQQIANMTGLRVETVIRTIRHLNEIGSLDIVNGKVFI